MELGHSFGTHLGFNLSGTINRCVGVHEVTRRLLIAKTDDIGGVFGRYRAGCGSSICYRQFRFFLEP